MKTQDYKDYLTASMIRLSVAFCLAIVLFMGCGFQPYDGISAPVLISPEDGSTITQNPPVFIWHRVEDAIEYNLQVADNSFDSVYALIIDLSCHPDTSYSPLDAINAGTCYWRAQAIAGG